MSISPRQAEIGERVLAVDVGDEPPHLPIADVEQARSRRPHLSELQPARLAPPDPAQEHEETLVVLNDVRCVPTGARCGAANASGPSDYSGEMRFSFTFRLTDHFNATAPGGGTDTATAQDFTIEHSWPCMQSGSTSTGSTCDLDTSLGTLIPGAVRDGKRATWGLAGAPIYDGGADGDGDTTPDNAVFARPGVFIP